MADRSLLSHALNRMVDAALHAFALAGGLTYYLGHWQIYCLLLAEAAK